MKLHFSHFYLTFGWFFTVLRRVGIWRAVWSAGNNVKWVVGLTSASREIFAKDSPGWGRARVWGGTWRWRRSRGGAVPRLGRHLEKMQRNVGMGMFKSGLSLISLLLCPISGWRSLWKVALSNSAQFRCCVSWEASWRAALQPGLFVSPLHVEWRTWKGDYYLSTDSSSSSRPQCF